MCGKDSHFKIFSSVRISTFLFEGKNSKNNKMKEDFLHYVWRMKKFGMKNLKTTVGQEIMIKDFGLFHRDAGPDFQEARLKIGETEWAGNVEMHVKASDWYQHRHDRDKAYDNVILHVVFEEDVPVTRNTGERLPCLELKGRIPRGLQNKYLRFLHEEKRIPCEGPHLEVPAFTWNLWLERMIAERLEMKAKPIAALMKECNNDKEEVFYRLLACNFGMRVNYRPFEHLARILPLNIIRKNKDKRSSIEALLFGQANLIPEEPKDEYTRLLSQEYSFLKKKYGLQSMEGSSWKKLRLRPANFPTIRISQFAGLLQGEDHLWDRASGALGTKELKEIFSCAVSEYWQNRYLFDSPVGLITDKKLGESTKELIIINSVVPMLFWQGMYLKDEGMKERAIGFLRELQAEDNQILRIWKELGVKPVDAGQSQALLHLKKHYCNEFKCLNCAVGNRILSAKDTKRVNHPNPPLPRR